MAKYDWKIEPRDEDWSDDTYAYFLIHINIKRMAEYLNKEFKKDWWFKSDFGQDYVWIVAEHKDFPVRLFFNFNEDGWADIVRHYIDGSSYTDDHLGSWHYAKYDINYSFDTIKDNIKNYFKKFEESKKSNKKSLKEAKVTYNTLAKLNDDLWDELGVNSGSELRGDSKKYEMFIEKVDEFLRNKGIVSIPRSVYDKLEDNNIHTLNLVLENLGMYDDWKESKKSIKKFMKESSKILAKNKKGKVVGYIEPQKDGSFGYAFGSPSQKEVIMFYVDTLEQAKDRIAEHGYDDVIFESKKSARKSLKESSDSILDKEFYNLVKEGYIYDEDENGMNMSYGEYAAVSDDLWEVLENELKHYRDFPSAYDAYEEIMNNTGDDAKMFMGVSDDDYFYFSIDEDEGTYTFDGKVPFVLEKLFKEFQKETDLERA